MRGVWRRRLGVGLTTVSLVGTLALTKLQRHLREREREAPFRDHRVQVVEHLGRADFVEFVWGLLGGQSWDQLEFKESIDLLFDWFDLEMVVDDVKRIDQAASTIPQSYQEFADFLQQLLPIPGDQESHASTEKMSVENRFHLHSRRNSIRNYNPHEVHHDMNRPFCQYLISSSHNTYLNGNQLRSKSSPENYLLALQQGYRCIEIDIWNGSSNEEPHPKVYHGHTLTDHNILFGDVLEVIKENAFLKSPYPIFISLEVRCSLSQQHAATRILREMFGDMLAPPFESYESYLDFSPERLKNKVLLMITGPEVMSETPSPYSEDLLRISHFIEFPRYQTPDYYELAGFKNLVPFVNISEDRISASASKNALFYGELLRVYPAGFRVQSSNPDPIKFWQVGSNFVALNRQTESLPVRVNQAFFEGNGGCGYILKPSESCRRPFLESFRDWNVAITSNPQLFGPGYFFQVQMLPDDARRQNLGDLLLQSTFSGEGFSRHGELSFLRIALFQRQMGSLSSSFHKNVLRTGIGVDSSFDEVEYIPPPESECLVPVHQLQLGLRSVTLKDPRTRLPMHRILVDVSLS